jgi:hypothetical protein
MKKFLLITAVMTCLFASAAPGHYSRKSRAATRSVRNDSIEKTCSDLMDTLRTQYESGGTTSSEGISPYYFPLLSSWTQYYAPVRSALRLNYGSEATSPFEEREQEVSGALLSAYLSHPRLFSNTQSDVTQGTKLRAEPRKRIEPEVKLSEKVVEKPASTDVGELTVVTYKPNFWTFKGSFSLQFTQTGISDNWYKGGENTSSFLASTTLEAHYNNKQKVKWDNTLELKLGFYTVKSDTLHKFKTNSDLLRFTTSYGLQATKHWYYSLQAQMYTQFYPQYKSNDKKVYSDFMSPFNLTLSPGMEYSYEKNKFKCSFKFSPVAYNFRSVDRVYLATSFGIDANKHAYHHFGPNISGTYSTTLFKNVKYSGRIYWFSDLQSTTVEWENTIDFQVNKYISARLFLYPRFDDTTPSRYDENLGYIMYTQTLSLGLNYSF